MLRRSVLSFTRRPLSTMASQTPMEDAMRTKITEALRPSTLEIHNDSHLHSHHKAMAGSTSQETHFRVVITSEAFKSKMQPARHRMVYALLKEEMAREGGIHALQLRTRTLDEETKQAEREAAEKGESIDAKVDTA
ncbi:bola-like protein [Hyaloscypha variabilis]